MRSRGMLSTLTIIVLPFLLFEALKWQTSLDAKIVAPDGHFYIVSAVALLSFLIAIAVGISGIRLRNIKVSFLALAFISLAEVFTVHGLSTPGFLIHANHLSGIAAQSSILLASMWLFLSCLSPERALIVYISRARNLLVPVWAVTLTGLAIFSLSYPHFIEHIPLNQAPLKGIMTVIILLLNGYTAYKYYRTYEYSRFPLQLAIVYSSGWLMTAQYIMAFGQTWKLSWWTYHFLLMGSMIVMMWGLWRQYCADKSLFPALKALFTNDPVERITGSMSPSVKSLIQATESKDTYTAGHNFRVTMYALKLAEELKIGPDQMRALAQGSIIHDVGKINIPDSILNKPGRLTEEERAIIELHPVQGYEVCKRLGFLKEELQIIRGHHEKWDGTGYPDRLRGEHIPYLARIVAVADVYDALTSYRSYRQAWSHAEAMDFLNDKKGTHFDPSMVEAWYKACERDPQIYLTPFDNENRMVVTAG